MIITKKIAEAIIDKHKVYAPAAAKVILVHEDARVFFAEKFEQGCLFWSADTMRESKLQGLIHKLTLVAKRNDQGDWVGVADFSSKVTPPTPKSRQERILEAQENLRAARASKPKPDQSPTIIPATKVELPPVSEKAVDQLVKKRGGEFRKTDTEYAHLVKPVELVKPVTSCEVIKSLKSIQPFIPNSPGDDEFISIRELGPVAARRVPDELFVSFRSDGKIIFCKALRETLPWPQLELMVSRNFARFAIKQGKTYSANQSGTYVNKALRDKINFPADSGTVRVIVEWDETLNMYVGEFQ